MAGQTEAAILPTPERLLQAATRLFADAGYEATTVGDIEAAVGLVPRRGTLYKHFASKEALLHAVVDARVREADAFLALAEAATAHDLGALSDGELSELIGEVGRGFLRQLDNHRDLTRIVEHDGERFPEIRERIRTEVIRPGYQAVAHTLADFAPSGTDAPAHAALLLAALTGLRRTAWTFGSTAYNLSDRRALDAWSAQCVLLLRG